ncbi:hypothetical protein [Desulfobacula sp.]|uniref:hypothetical protein n=1 Tax=Desulfobacula sp. TaxID=2593537 RepID=UPI001ED25465|nr:hypothetical protein [Desulfobacula sp.]
MNTIKKFPQQKKISDSYPLLPIDRIPKVFETQIVDHRIEELNEYHVGIWHRFFSKFYGQPSEMNSFLCKAKQQIPISKNNKFQIVGEAAFRTTDGSKIEFLNLDSNSLKKYADGELTISPGGVRDWKYFFELPSQNIIFIGSKNDHRELFLSLVDPDYTDKKIIIAETKKFISVLLEEMKKQHGNLFNPRKEFKEKNITSYSLWNVYLSNYLSAEHLIIKAEDEENKLTENLYKFSDKSVLIEDEASVHTQSVLLICGTYYSSSIFFLWMALEGFINILFHRFVKKNIDDLDMERGLDLEQKIRLMPYLCEGFKNDVGQSISDIYEDFIRLKDYRNKLFHSKVEDSLCSIMDYYKGFFYNYHMDEYRTQFLPSNKAKLTMDSVLQVKSLVDGIIDNIINAMDEKAKDYTKKYILSESAIPFMNVSGTDPLI